MTRRLTRRRQVKPTAPLVGIGNLTTALPSFHLTPSRRENDTEDSAYAAAKHQADRHVVEDG